MLELRCRQTSHRRKPSHASTLNLNIAEKHLAPTHPQPELSIECAIYDQRLLGFRVFSRPDHLVQVALIVPIDPRGNLGDGFNPV